jgi:hypothetical protein
VALLSAVLLAGTVATGALAATPSTTTLAVASGSPQQENHPITLVAVVAPSDVDFSTDATIDFIDTDADPDVVVCTAVAVDPGNETSCTIEDPAAGTHHFKAAYSGNTALDPSESTELEVVVAADTVDAHAVGRNYATFYPYKDGYRDTLKISGVREEPISVRIRIYNSDNRKVKEFTRSAATGGYSATWNGRNAAGNILAAGKYRILQRLTDAAGTQKDFTSYVTLSKKRLVTKTIAVSKNADAAARWGHTGTASATRIGAHGLRIKAGTGDAALAWQFRIPSAVVYKSVSFRVDAATKTVNPATVIGMQSFNRCARSSNWDTDCFNRLKAIGNSSGARRWYTTNGSVSANRDGRYVRGMIYLFKGRVDLYRVQVRVKYQILQ